MRPNRWGAGPGRDLAVVLTVLVALGAVCGLAWAQVVAPAEYTRVARGAAMGEDQVALQFDADGWYLLISLGAGLLAGALLTWRVGRDALVTCAALVAGSVVAAVTMAVVGYLAGPSEPDRVLATAPVGTAAPETLGVGPASLLPVGDYLASLDASWVVYLGWPLGLLFGALVVLLGTPPTRHLDGDSDGVSPRD